MKKDKRFSLRLRTYYLLIIAIVVIISFGAVVGALTALQQLGVIGHINVSTLVALLLVAAAASGSASFLVGRRVLAPMVKLSKASREVARGNYSITVEDPSKLEEVQTTLRNFNALVREMNRINNVTNDFVSSVSHEFKTPLTAIEGYAMLLQDTGLTQAERDEYLDKILYNTHRLSTLVGNILMLSKLENQSLSDQRSTFRLDEQLRQAVVMLEPQWEEKSLSFRAELDAVSVTACEPLLLQVWTNLIGNAIKFSEPGQELSLRLLDQTECAVVSVTDHGCGMTPEVQARIFEKFYQGDSSRKAMGNGLGLPLVKRIVELSDGVIEVDSAPGQGPTFRVILPKSKTDAAGFYRCSVSACRKTLSTRWKTAKKFGRQATRTRRRTKVR
ncbi:MAG: ATP-binding protein [Oscillospiraceae bacterium]